MKLTYNNLDTKYTIDTYSTFTSDDYELMEMEKYNSEYSTNHDYSDFDWKYDHEAILKNLSNNSISYILQEIDKNIIQSIEVKDCRSPREYNFTTDSYTVEVEYNDIELNKYINDNLQGFKDYCKEACTSYDGYMAFNSYDEAIEKDLFKVLYYVDSLYTYEYMDYMYDNLYELYIDTVEMTLTTN